MSVLREIIAKFGVSFDDRELKQGNKSIANAVTGLKGLVTAVAGSAMVAGVASFVGHIRGVADELDKASGRLGLSTDALQQWRLAAQFSGVSAGDLDIAMKSLQKNAFAAANGSKEMADIFKKLGVETTGAGGELRSLDDLLFDVGDALSKTVNAGDRTAIAMRLMEESGNKLLPMFAGGAEGMRKMREEAVALGGGLSAETIEASVELTDQLARLDFAMLSLKGRIANVLLPAFNFLVATARKVTVWFREVTENTSAVEAGFVVLGAAAVVALAPLVPLLWSLLVPMLPWIAGLGLAFIIVEDLMTTFKGGDSITRRFIDGLFGEGKTQEIVDNIKATWDAFQQFFSDLKNKPTEFAETFKRTLDTIRQDIADAFGPFWGGILQGAFDAFIVFVDILTGGWDNAMTKLSALANGAALALEVLWMELGFAIAGVAASIGDAFAATWNGIVSGAQGAVQAVRDVLASLPFTEGIVEGIDKGIRAIGGAKAATNTGQFVTGERDKYRAFAADRFDAIGRVLSPASAVSVPAGRGGPANVQNQVSQSVVVNVPPGTPGSMARDVARETGKAINNMNARATLEAGALGT